MAPKGKFQSPGGIRQRGPFESAGRIEKLGEVIRKEDGKGRSLSKFALDLDFPMEPFNDVFNNGQPQAASPGLSGHRAVDLPERFEDDGEVFFFDPDAGILN